MVIPWYFVCPGAYDSLVGNRRYCTSCRICGVGWYMYNVRVGDHCAPVDIQPRTASNAIWAGVLHSGGLARAQGE